MDTLENLLAQAEAEETDSAWEVSDKYETKEFYSDDDGYVRVIGRKIDNIEGHVSVQGEELSQYVEFRMNRFYDGVDLTTMTLSIYYQVSEDLGGESSLVNVAYNDLEIKFGWAIPASVTQYTEIEFHIWARGTLPDGSSYILKTIPKKYVINRGLVIGGSIPEPDQNWYLTFVRSMDTKVSVASAHANAAKSSASEAKAASQNVDTKASQVDTQHSEVKTWHEEAKQYSESAKDDAERARLYADTVQEGITTTTLRELADSYAGGIRIISMDGESQQKQYSGKNLLQNTASTKTINGVTFTVNDDGSILINGTASKKATFIIKSNVTLEKGKYIFAKDYRSYSVNSGVDQNKNGSYEIVAASHGAEFEVTDENVDRTFTFYVQIIANVTISNFTFYPLLRKSSDDDTYEPFVGGIASPNPDYPQDIESVEVSEIWTHGKNLEYNSATYEGWNVWSWDGTIIGEIYNGGKVIKYGAEWQFRYPPSRLFKAGTYTVSFDARVKNSGNALVYSQSLGLSKEISITASSTFKRYSYTFTVAEDKRGWITVLIPSGSTVGELYVANIQVEYGSETEYEPYTETKETLSAPITLRGIGDAKDTIVKKDGVFGVKRNIKKLDLSTITSWTKGYGFTNASCLYNSSALSDAVRVVGYNTKSDIMCNRLQIDTASNITENEKDAIGQGEKTLYVSFVGVSTSDDLNSYLSENETYVYYKLATPTFEPLPLADQIALHKLETFGGVTYLFTDSTIEPIIEVEYGTSKVGGYAIKGLNTADANALMIEQLKTLTNELATQIVAGSEA